MTGNLAHLKQRVVSNIRHLKLLITTDNTRPTKAIAAKTTLTAHLGLHWVVTIKKQDVWHKHYFFLCLAVKSVDSHFIRTTYQVLQTTHKFHRRSMRG